MHVNPVGRGFKKNYFLNLFGKQNAAEAIATGSLKFQNTFERSLGFIHIDNVHKNKPIRLTKLNERCNTYSDVIKETCWQSDVGPPSYS